LSRYRRPQDSARKPDVLQWQMPGQIPGTPDHREAGVAKKMWPAVSTLVIDGPAGHCLYSHRNG